MTMTDSQTIEHLDFDAEIPCENDGMPMHRDVGTGPADYLIENIGGSCDCGRGDRYAMCSGCWEAIGRAIGTCMKCGATVMRDDTFIIVKRLKGGVHE